MTTPDDFFAPQKKKSVVREYAESLFWAFLLAFVIRSFIVEPYKIPSKSMVPTLLVGDHIFVSKFAYGLRIPGTKKWIARFDTPKRGDVIVFIYPGNDSDSYIKRVIGLPGDRVVVHEGNLYVNGEKISETAISIAGVDPTNARQLILNDNVSQVPEPLKPLPYFAGYKNFEIYLENLFGREHTIQKSRFLPNLESDEVVVPEGHYFVMGDNRDQSLDSRAWGFVPEENLKGRALFIWLSLDSEQGGIRFKRFGKKII